MRLDPVHEAELQATALSDPGEGTDKAVEESLHDGCSVNPAEETPLERICLRLDGQSRKVFLKLEGANPGGSIKDRTALSLLQNLEATGKLTKGGRLVESSSGNLAIGLARLARRNGYHFTAVLDPRVTAENLLRLRDLGAETVMVEEPDSAGGYLLSRLARIQEMLREDPQLRWTNQYGSEANPAAHYSGTAPELFQQMGRRVDAVFVAVSTGGTLAGMGRFFRENSPHTRIIAVDARGSAVFGDAPGARKLVGIGSSRQSEFLDGGLYDEHIHVDDNEAFSFCRALKTSTGISVGGSSGACLAACARYLQLHSEIERAVCLCADRGEHYTSSIFSDSWLAQQGLDVGPGHLGSVTDISW
jgi:N-(2-amino-2-carboxyethyl)-L-glutamate synthase